MSLRQVIYRVMGVGGSVNYQPEQTAGIRSFAVGLLGAASQAVATKVEQSPMKATSNSRLGNRLTRFSSGESSASKRAALRSRSLATLPLKESPAASVVEIKYDLLTQLGSNAATSTGANAWTSPANAEGLKNGTLARALGNVLNARVYQLTLAYRDYTGKEVLAVTGAELRFYINHSGLVGNTSRNLTVTWAGGSWTSGVQTAPSNTLTVPFVLDLAALGVDTWAELNSLGVVVDATTAVGAAGTQGVDVDAIELIVTATHTDTL